VVSLNTYFPLILINILVNLQNCYFLNICCKPLIIVTLFFSNKYESIRFILLTYLYAFPIRIIGMLKINFDDILTKSYFFVIQTMLFVRT